MDIIELVRIVLLAELGSESRYRALQPCNPTFQGSYLVHLRNVTVEFLDAAFDLVARPLDLAIKAIDEMTLALDAVMEVGELGLLRGNG